MTQIKILFHQINQNLKMMKIHILNRHNNNLQPLPALPHRNNKPPPPPPPPPRPTSDPAIQIDDTNKNTIPSNKPKLENDENTYSKPPQQQQQPNQGMSPLNVNVHYQPPQQNYFNQVP
eukprot:274230_1